MLALCPNTVPFIPAPDTLAAAKARAGAGAATNSTASATAPMETTATPATGGGGIDGTDKQEFTFASEAQPEIYPAPYQKVFRSPGTLDVGRPGKPDRYDGSFREDPCFTAFMAKLEAPVQVLPQYLWLAYSLAFLFPV